MDSSACNIVSYKYYSDSSYQTISTSITSYTLYGAYNLLNINVASGATSFWWTAVFSDGSEKQVDYQENKKFVAGDCVNYITFGSLDTKYSAFIG